MFTIVFGIHYNFFTVLPENFVDLLIFSFLQSKMCAPEKLCSPQRFYLSGRTQLASGAQFVQAWIVIVSVILTAYIIIFVQLILGNKVNGNNFHKRFHISYTIDLSYILLVYFVYTYILVCVKDEGNSAKRR